jgi:hypothetical protein
MKEDRTMIFFPNQTIAHAHDVRGRVKNEFRRRMGRTEKREEVDQPWDVVDQASWESFPASDPPPWTLGYTGLPMRSAEVNSGPMAH